MQGDVAANFTEMQKSSLVEAARLGRLQRQALYCFAALGEALSSDLWAWCRPEVVYIEKRALRPWERWNVKRAARSIGAVRVRREGGQWVWRLGDTETE
jgi:hypothetical protein